jgi:hypothetical protein
MKDPGRGKRLKMFMAFHLPFFTDTLADLGAMMMILIEKLAMRKLWIGMDKKLHAYWYMRGVGDNVKTVAGVRSLFKGIGGLQPIEHEIDLAGGIEKAGQELSALKTHGVHLRYYSTPVATIRSRPGDMALGAHDLQALLANRYAWEYYEAMILNGKVKDKNAFT